MQFSATDAAFEGFRVTRRHPGAVLAWALVMLAANMLSGLAVGLLAGPAWGQFEALSALTPPDPVATAQLMPKVAPAAVASMLIQVVAAGVVNASVLRALLRPERQARLRLGRDEGRVIGLLLMFFLATIAATAALSVLLTLLGLALGAVVVALAPLASLVVLLVLTIRFSLAGPMTIAEHRFRFWPSWRATGPWIWPLLGAEVLAAALAVVVVVLAHIVFIALAGAVVLSQGGGFAELGTMFNPDFSAPAKLLNPAPLIYVTFVSVLYALVLVILVGPPVELYRLMQAERPRDGG